MLARGWKDLAWHKTGRVLDYPQYLKPGRSLTSVTRTLIAKKNTGTILCRSKVTVAMASQNAGSLYNHPVPTGQNKATSFIQV